MEKLLQKFTVRTTERIIKGIPELTHGEPPEGILEVTIEVIS